MAVQLVAFDEIVTGHWTHSLVELGPETIGKRTNPFEEKSNSEDVDALWKTASSQKGEDASRSELGFDSRITRYLG